MRKNPLSKTQLFEKCEGMYALHIHVPLLLSTKLVKELLGLPSETLDVLGSVGATANLIALALILLLGETCFFCGWGDDVGSSSATKVVGAFGLAVDGRIDVLASTSNLRVTKVVACDVA